MRCGAGHAASDVRPWWPSSVVRPVIAAVRAGAAMLRCGTDLALAESCYPDEYAWRSLRQVFGCRCNRLTGTDFNTRKIAVSQKAIRGGGQRHAGWRSLGLGGLKEWICQAVGAGGDARLSENRIQYFVYQKNQPWRWSCWEARRGSVRSPWRRRRRMPAGPSVATSWPNTGPWRTMPATSG